jgi:hypothetical protein
MGLTSDGGGHDRYAVSQQRRKDNEASQGCRSGISAPVQRRISAPIRSGISTHVRSDQSARDRARKSLPASGEQFATTAWCVLMATLDRHATRQARLFVLGVNLVPTHRQSLTARKKAGDLRFGSKARTAISAADKPKTVGRGHRCSLPPAANAIMIGCSISSFSVNRVRSVIRFSRTR